MKHRNTFFRSQLTLLKPFLENSTISAARRGQDAIGKLLVLTHRKGVRSEPLRIGSIECVMLTPEDEVSGGIILYLHGGGFITGSLDYAQGFGTVLCAECGMRVLCVSYRLAPEFPFPAALDDCLDAYGYLLSNGYSPDRIVLCGESAGGGLCYSLCLKLREKGRSMPACIIAISPWTDLTSSSPSYAENEKADPSMSVQRLKYFADCYVYGAEGEGKHIYPKVEKDTARDIQAKSDPLISPMFASCDRLPPSLIFVGGDEIMLGDSVTLHENLKKAGRKSELYITPHMWHGYVLYCLKENRRDFDRIRKFIGTNVPHQKKLRWMSLDNAAKIFPAARTRSWSNVFRLSATLNEDIDVRVLQSSLDVTVRRFPSIAVRIKTGFFWYYLEEIPAAPQIMEEKPYPLSRMPFDDIRKCAFRVIVYKNRIATEFFHALTDGNGGLIFLKTLVSEYIYQKYGVKVPFGCGVLDRLEEPNEEELEDSFPKYAGKIPASRTDTDAFKITGRRDIDGFKTNTTFIFDASRITDEAKKHGVTVTAYLAAALMLATDAVQRQRTAKSKKYRRVKILIPVNLRKMFPSKTLRNFVLYATVGIDPRLGEYDFDEICDIVHHQMSLLICKKNMESMIATNVNSEKLFIIKVVPLFIKNIVMKLVFNAVGEKKSCFTFSNLGVVKMPEEFEDKVSRLDFVLGSQAAAPYNTSAITYKGKLYLNMIRNISEPVLEASLYEVLRSLGLEPELESNTRGEI